MNSLSRRRFTQGVLAASTLHALGQQTTKREGKRPNVLFVMADEWRAQSFGYTGDSNAPTSTFDQFAKESVNFSQAVSGCSVCCPARASLLTGQYPLTHGVYINDVHLKPKVKTLGECFRDAGYKTGYIGKWHVYGSPDGHYGRRASYIPMDQRFGFDYWKVAECCHDYEHSFYYEGSDTTKKFWEGYDAQAQTDDACQFIRANANSDKPYFLTLSWGPPHFPLGTAPEKYRQMFANKEIALRPNVDPEHKEQAISDLRGYYAHMAALNDCFKQLLSAVDSTNGRDDTIVVFTSDHGDMMESQGLETKIYPWEESVRVPFLVRYPKRYGKMGHTSEVLLSTPDIMPTLLGLCDISIPEGVQGTDLSTLKFTKRTVGPSTTAFLNMPVPITTARQYGIAEYRGVRDLRYTYVRSIKGPWLLYDNKNDPYQMHNLIDRPEVKTVQARLDKELNMWLKALKDEFLPSETYLVRDNFTNYVEPYAGVIYTRSPWNDWESTLPAREFSVDSPISNMLKNPQARAILEREVPQALKVSDRRQVPGALVCIRQMQHTGLQISEAKLNEIDGELAKITSTPRNPLFGHALAAVMGFLFLLLSSTFCSAQITTAEVVGTVKDVGGTAVMSSTVVITNADTKETRNTVVDRSGNFSFALLPPGQYSLRITAPGYKAILVSGFVIRAGEHGTIQAPMQPGPSSESVPGTATITTSAPTGIVGKAVEDIPERQRNYVNLAQIQAGANEGQNSAAAGVDSGRPGAQHLTSTVSVNGQPDSLNQHILDGADNNERYQGISLIHPSVEAISAVQVKTSGLTADIGRTGGGVLIVTTKSGTNTLHGSLFEYFRNDILDPYPFLFGAKAKKQEIRQSQFGGSLGGPIKKGRTYFFADYEGFRLIQGAAPASVVVPTLYEENHPGDFSDIGGAVLTPSQIDPIGLDYFKLYPAPNSGTAQYSGAGIGYNFSHTVDVRADHTLAKGRRLSARFGYNKVTAYTPGVLPRTTVNGVTIDPGGNTSSFPGELDIDAYNMQLMYNHVINPHWAMSLIASYTGSMILKGDLGYGVNANATWGQPNINIDAKTSGLAPITVLNGDNIGNGDYNLPNPNHENSFEYKGSMTWTHGPHQVKFGSGLIRRQVRAPQDPNGEGQWTFVNYQTLLQGVYTAVQRNYSLVIQHFFTWEPSAYVMDTWRITPKVTVDAGVRYEIFTPYTELHNYLSTFDPVAGKILLAGQNRVNNKAGLNTDYSNFAPRLGFSWQSWNKTTLSGGFGVGYFMSNLKNRSEMTDMPFAFGYGPCSSSTCASAYSTFADGLPYPTTPDITNPTGSLATPVDPRWKTSYDYFYNLALQRTFVGNNLRVAYAGSLGRHLHQQLPDINTPPPNTATAAVQQTLRPYYSVFPNLKQIALLQSEGTSSYNGLQVVVNRQMRKHLSYGFNYTWAHGLDDATTPNTFFSGMGTVPSEIGKVVAGHRFDYGNSDMDLRHRIAGNFTYELPYNKSWRGVKKGIASNWQFNAVEAWATGITYTVTNGSGVSGTLPGQANAERPNVIADPNLKQPGVSEFFNVNAFQVQQSGTIGQLLNSGSAVGTIGPYGEAKNALHGPHNRKLDVSLAKTFPLGDGKRYNLLFRAEAFNLTNTANFAPPNHYLVPGSNGISTLANGFGRLTALSANYTPRDIQFVMKIQF